LTAQLLLAVHAITTCDLETGNNSVAYIQVGNLGTLLFDSSAELVAEDVAAFHLNDGAMEEMEIGTTDRAASDFENDIAVLYDDGTRYFLDLDVAFAHPAERLHGLGGVTILRTVAGGVGDILM